MIYLAADHGGFQLKNRVKEFLVNKGLEVIDLGAHDYNPEDDYTDFVLELADKVASDPINKGIVSCRNGAGVSIAVNKNPKIRATLSWTVHHAASTRTDDDTNVLALPGDYIDENTAIEIVDAWLATSFSQEERHQRRLSKIDDYSRNLRTRL